MRTRRIAAGGLLLGWATMLVTTAALAADIYESKGEQGEPLFTDRPAPGAVKRRVDPNVVRFSAPPASATAAPDTPAESAEAAPKYEVEVTKPAPEATVRDNAGRVEIEVAVTPELGEGATVQIFLDGEPAGDAGRSLTRTLTNVDRGAHRVHAAVNDAGGRIVASSRGVTFYLHRVSRLTRPPGPPGPATPESAPGSSRP